MRDASLAADLECSGCGRKLVEDGHFKCVRCKVLVEATLGQKRIYCPNCSSPRVLLARNDEALCPESRSRCPNRKAGKGTPMATNSKQEQEMAQTTTDQEASSPVGKSKTQELRNWLHMEIECADDDIATLQNALAIPKGATGAGGGYGRYTNLTSEERETKMKEDRQKLEQIKQRLELFKSAQELDVDVDALEQAGIELRRREAHILSFLIEGTLNFVSLNSVGLMSFVLICDTRTLNIFITSPSADVSVRSHHYLKDITSFSVFSQKHEGCDTHSIECRHSVDENGNGWLFKVRWTITHSQPHDTVLCSVDHVPFNKK